MNRLELIDPILQFLGIPASKVFGGAGSNKDPNVNVYDDVMRAFNDHEKKKQKKLVRINSNQAQALCEMFFLFFQGKCLYDDVLYHAYTLHFSAIRSSNTWMWDETIKYLDFQIRYGVNKNFFLSYEKNFPLLLSSLPVNDESDPFKRFDFLMSISLVVSYQLLTLRLWMNYIEKRVCIEFKKMKKIFFFTVNDYKLLREFIIVLEKMNNSIKPMVEKYRNIMDGKISEERMKEMLNKINSGKQIAGYLHMLIHSFLNGPDISLANHLPAVEKNKKLLDKYLSFFNVYKQVPLTKKNVDELGKYAEAFPKIATDEELSYEEIIFSIDPVKLNSKGLIIKKEQKE